MKMPYRILSLMTLAAMATLSACDERKDTIKRTITLDLNGGVALVKTFTVNHGQRIAPPADPVREGYNFLGWFVDRDLKNAFNFSTTSITADITLYAKYNSLSGEEIPEQGLYTVKFDTQGGSEVADQILREGYRAARPVPPSKAGFTFANWYANKDFKDDVFFFHGIIVSDTTLYAKYVPIGTPSYTVTFDTQGGSQVASQLVYEGEKAYPPDEDPLRTDVSTITNEPYLFIEWRVSTTATRPFNFATTPITTDTTLYAVWGGVDDLPAPPRANGVYLVSTWRHLQKAAELKNPNNPRQLVGRYDLQNDIVIPDGYNWLPIGNVNAHFTGSIDGKGHTVRNLYIHRPNQNSVGLLGYIEGVSSNGGIVKNIAVEFAAGGVTGGANVGALVGSTDRALYGSASGQGTVRGSFNVGGLVGEAKEHVQVYGYTTVKVIAEGSDQNPQNNGQAGGLVGYASGQNTIVGYATGAVSSSSQNVGGLVGYLFAGGKVYGYATGVVSGENATGGLVGNAAATGTASSSPSKIVGYARGSITRNNGSSNVAFGRLVGVKGDNQPTGYYSGKQGESQLINILPQLRPITGENAIVYDGAVITVSAATTAIDFKSFIFDVEPGGWTFTPGQWPAINLPADVGGKYKPGDQPTSP